MARGVFFNERKITKTRLVVATLVEDQLPQESLESVRSTILIDGLITAVAIGPS